MRETSKIRAGEELDVDSLAGYLRKELGFGPGGLEVRQFPAGNSNLTYLVNIDGTEFVLRRPPFGNRVRSAHDMSREYRVLSRLKGIYAPAPDPVLFCDDESVIGSEFYLMERRRGLILRGSVPEPLAQDKSLRRGVCRSFVKNLADLHSIDHQAAGLADLGNPEGYVQRQVVGWSKRYFNAKTDDWPELEESIFWLNNNIPRDGGSASLVHNDYKFDNVILDPADPARIIGVLDWEMAAIGSPLMDLGTTLGYWMSRDAGAELMAMPFNPKVLMEEVSRSEITEMYSEFSGLDLEEVNYYYVFGTVKIAVIAQQIYFRYKKGFTRDERFASFGGFVSKLGTLAADAIRKGSL